MLIRNGCRHGCVKTVRTAEVMIWIMSVASELGDLLISRDKEARGRVGRPSRGCGRVYRRQLEHRGRCTRRTALRLAAAGGHTAPVVQTILQRFSLAGRGAGRQLEPRLVSTPSAACCCCTLPHVAQGRSRCHHACCPHGSALASLNWPLSAAPTVFRHFLGSRETASLFWI